MGRQIWDAREAVFDTLLSLREPCARRTALGELYNLLDAALGCFASPMEMMEWTRQRWITEE